MEIQRKTFTDCKNNSFQVSVMTLGGKKPGPVFTIVSGQHGMEHSGPCFLPELAEELDKMDIAGTLHICPCANPGALAMDYEFYPEHEDLSKINDYYYSRFRHDYSPWGIGRGEAQTEYNMNRLWNRKGEGIAYDITAWLWENFVEDAYLTLDIHCLQALKPMVYNDFAKNNPLIALTGIEAVWQCSDKKSEYGAGNLNYQAARREGRYAFCIEFSSQHALKESEYELGKNAIRNLMIKLGMIKGEYRLSGRPTWSIPLNYGERADIFVTSHGGHIRYFFDEYDQVKKGDKVYQIRDIQTLEVLEEGFASRDGIMGRRSYLPVMKAGVTACSVIDAERLIPEF
jgi:predicted deacylase